MIAKKGIIFNNIFLPDTKRCQGVLEDLENMAEHSDIKFERIELYPYKQDIFTDVVLWRVKTQKDKFKHKFLIMDFPYIYEPVNEWAQKYIHIKEDNLFLASGMHYIKDCCSIEATGEVKIKAYGHSSVTAYLNSTITAFDNSVVHAHDFAEIAAYDSTEIDTFVHVGKVDAWHNSKVVAYSGSTVNVMDNSTVEAHGARVIIPSHSLAQEEQISLSDDAILINYKNSTISANRRWDIKKIDRP